MNISPWGKFKEYKRHHLAHHCADVAACFAALVCMPVLRARLDRLAGRPLSEQQLERLELIAFLHDAGKLHPGFQAKGWPPSPWRPALRGHVSEGWAALSGAAAGGRISGLLHLERLADWGVDGGLLRASIGHHGRPFQDSPDARQAWSKVEANGYDPVEAAAEIGQILPHWFPLAFAPGGDPLPRVAPFQHLFCGLVSLADWVGSNRALFPFEAILDPNYMQAKACDRAQAAVAAVGLDSAIFRRRLRAVNDFAAIAPTYSPRKAQSAVADWPLDDTLLILEAETGAGKTEAALWRFAKLFAAGEVDGLYFALPTRSAAVQIHDRILKVVDNLFDGQGPEPVLAIPGYLKAGNTSGVPLPEYSVLWDDNPDEATLLSRWAAESSKRYLAAAISVGTVDQAMLAAMQVKHAHLRLAALSRSLLVIDEIHASDHYQGRVQQALVEAHRRHGGHVMLMSATLGSVERDRWRLGKPSQPPILEDALAAPYPALWGGRSAAPRAVPAEGRDKTVRLTLSEDWEPQTAAAEAIKAARAGARVVVLRNTVTAAVATFNAVIEAGEEALLWRVAGGPALHHARFADEDRVLLDDEVAQVLSSDSKKRSKTGVIVIGTQTLQQALDYCADYLITDLCPMDVLLQRIGRLHRHKLERPEGFEAPQCLVLQPKDGLDPLIAPRFDNGLGAWDESGILTGIYVNLPACELTRRLIRDHPDWTIPKMNRFLVESATHEDAIEALIGEKGPEWSRFWDRYTGGTLAAGQAGKRVTLDVFKPLNDPDSLFPTKDEAQIRTRLGADGARVELATPVEGPFGSKVSAFTLPGHWGLFPEGTCAARREADGSLRVEIGDRAIRCLRSGVERETG